MLTEQELKLAIYKENREDHGVAALNLLSQEAHLSERLPDDMEL